MLTYDSDKLAVTNGWKVPEAARDTRTGDGPPPVWFLDVTGGDTIGQFNSEEAAWSMWRRLPKDVRINIQVRLYAPLWEEVDGDIITARTVNKGQYESGKDYWDDMPLDRKENQRFSQYDAMG